ncbi:acyl-CoA-binding domain-containing protein 4 isoform X3 [Catharus ustulatus]|nr:acyl-CoA-binding domain-containing protein 4 isoform X3 [Catharus ustulatus]
MLRFYSYYKQATAGCCQGPRPGFWDPIGRYKWDAWHSLGRMSKEEAMAAYVAEMKKVAQKVIDTVPMDESTEEMFRYFEPLYEVIHDMPRPPESFFKKKGESQGRLDGPSQDIPASSPAPESPRDTVPGEQQDRQQVPGAGLVPAPEALKGSQVTSDSEGDMFCDTLEQMEPEKARQVWGLTPNRVQAGAEPPVPHSAGQGEWGEGRRAEGSSSTDLTALGSETGACRACPCSPCCCCSTSHRLGWGVGAATTPRRLSLAPAPMSSLTEGSYNCPVSVPLGPQAVQWLYSCRTQPFLCPFLAVVQIAYIWRVLCWPFSSQAGNAGAWLPVPSSCPWSNHTSSAFGCGWCQG